MNLLLESIKMDWPVLLPIFLCSILVVGVVISKWSFYSKNQRDITIYMRELTENFLKMICLQHKTSQSDVEVL